MMKFSELVDFLLVLLYDVEQYYVRKQMPVGYYLPLDFVAGDLAEPVPRQWLTDAAKILEMKGFAECIYTFGGGCKARITGLGRLEVEQNKAKDLDGFKERVWELLKRHEQIPTGETIEEERKPALDVIEGMKTKLAADSSLVEKEKEDLLFDLYTVEAQIKRREPNRPLLAALLDEFSRVPSVADDVAGLVRLFNP